MLNPDDPQCLVVFDSNEAATNALHLNKKKLGRNSLRISEPTPDQLQNVTVTKSGTNLDVQTEVQSDVQTAVQSVDQLKKAAENLTDTDLAEMVDALALLAHTRLRSSITLSEDPKTLSNLEEDLAVGGAAAPD